MGEQSKACFIEGFRSIEVCDGRVTIVADCLHVSGSIPESAPSEGRNSRLDKGRVAEQPVSSRRGKKPL